MYSVIFIVDIIDNSDKSIKVKMRNTNMFLDVQWLKQFYQTPNITLSTFSLNLLCSSPKNKIVVCVS